MPQHTINRLAKLNAALAMQGVLRKIERLCTLAVGTPEYAGLDAARTLISAEYERLWNEYRTDHDAWKESVHGIVSHLAG